MKNKLLLVLATVVGILIIGVIVKNLIQTDLKKNDPMAYNPTCGISSKTETKVVPVKPEVKHDSTNYWRADNKIKYDRPSDLYYFKDLTSGILYTYQGDDNGVHKVQFEFDFKRMGDLMLISYNGQTESWIVFNENTLVASSFYQRNDKLRRIGKKVE